MTQRVDSECEYHSYSPPQYQKRAKAREDVLVLENRLMHFLEWLSDKGFTLVEDAPALGTGCLPVVQDREYLLVMEYVES